MRIFELGWSAVAAWAVVCVLLAIGILVLTAMS
jgi:hypothetical protein